MFSWFSRTRLSLLVLSLLLLVQVSAAEGWDPWRAAPPDKVRDQESAHGVAALLPRSFAPLLADGSTALQARRLAGLRAPDALQAIAVMVDFADSCFYGREDEFPGPLPTSTQSDFYYAAHDSLYYHHLLRDVADYFAAASGERFSLEYAVHGQVAGLDVGMGFYGDHPEEGEQPIVLARDAIAMLDAAVDFSLYDTVLLIHAGAGEETDVLDDSPEQIYSTYLGPEDFAQAVEDSILDQPYIPTADFPEGEGVRHVLILPENQFQDAFEGYSGFYGSLGTYCFEVGLRLGMLSLTDFTPAGSPDSQGIGQFGLMGYGLFSAGGFVPPQPCAFNKQLMGWLAPQQVDVGAADTWVLHPSEFPAHPRAAARVDLTGAEYYLLEYRLQDPDGNRIFSFTGDRNGNNVPDFWDASNPPTHVPVWGEFFDPDEDEREWFDGAEWDFFLSDNTAREEGVKGAGSGIYIWHIDEGVVRDAFGQRRNLFNANPQRKSVDLEEADGIQDLDTREPSAWWLGGDDDSYRAEDNGTFGPDSRPDTRTNGGLRSGIVIDAISPVVVDSAHTFNPGGEDEYVGILYADSMTFRCALEGGTTLVPSASRDLPGVDLTGSHLLAADLAAGIGEDLAYVAAADSGRIFVFDAQLDEWVDHDGDPDTFAPFAVGTDDEGQPVEWLLPAAAGQFAADDAGLEIVVASPGGVYAFRSDGTPLVSGPGGTSVGLIAELPVTTAAILLPRHGGADPDSEVLACVGTTATDVEGAPTVLRFLDEAGEEARTAVSLAGWLSAAPVRYEDILFATVVASDASGILQAVSWPESGDPEILWTVALDLVPGAQPPLVSAEAVLVTAADGRGQTVVVSSGAPLVQPLWDASVVVQTPLGAGGVFVGDGRLGRIGDEGAWLIGWPRRPQPEIRSPLAQPLALGPVDQPAGFLFTSRDGRLFLTDAAGQVEPDWPQAGPADMAATPVLVGQGIVGGEAGVTLVVAGTTPEIAGVDAQDELLVTSPVARLRVYDLALPAAFLPDPLPVMYGGGPWRGLGVRTLLVDPQEPVSLATTHVCYPQPLTTEVLTVRGRTDTDGFARAVIYNLQGETVRTTERVAVRSGSPFDLVIDMQGVASGLYLCKLEAGGQTSVKTIAVAQ